MNFDKLPNYHSFYIGGRLSIHHWSDKFAGCCLRHIAVLWTIIDLNEC